MPQIFGKISETVLIKICSPNARKVHIIFGRYLTPSIKDCEFPSLQQCNIPYTIHGPLQSRPKNFLESSKNYHFKEALVQFLSIHCEDDSLLSILDGKKVFITAGKKCYSFCSIENRVFERE